MNDHDVVADVVRDYENDNDNNEDDENGFAPKRGREGAAINAGAPVFPDDTKETFGDVQKNA